MKISYLLFSVFALFLALGIVSAQQGNQSTKITAHSNDSNQKIGGDKDEYGCLTAAGYSWNESEKKCVKEWETGDARYQEKQENQTQQQTQERTREKLRDGTYEREGGKQIQVQTKANNKIQLKTGNSEAETDLEIESETENGKTKLKAKLSNGRNAEIKIMPDTASEKALERLRLKVCNENNNCSIELKEVGKQDDTKPAYEIQAERHSRILGIFRAKMQVRAQIDAENGEVIKVKKPWWAFLAAEPEE
ncbi:hypothetical protein GF386_02110 [Candidatus Pacearchaeota archaeon]|nr:hypothetical protein [Candidatus Pacearchaeota archaeon]MBD3282962.1 hypothetical protein [Candidatus Pacearchaeota archaeon]